MKRCGDCGRVKNKEERREQPDDNEGKIGGRKWLTRQAKVERVRRQVQGVEEQRKY